MTPLRTSLLCALSLSLTASVAAAQELVPMQVSPASQPTLARGRLVLDSEGDAAALEVYGPGGSNTARCTTPCTLSMPYGEYTVEARDPGALTAAVRVTAPAQRYVYRRGGAGVGWKVLTVWGAINAGSGLLLLGLGAIGLASSSSLDRTFGTVGIAFGIIGLASGALMLIPGAIGWARAPGPSLREQNEVASLRALHSRRFALMNTGVSNPLALAPSAPASSLSLSFTLPL
ncbi:MAG: hypothetical protein U0269_11245 [Polyangiales bacterium]